MANAYIDAIWRGESVKRGTGETITALGEMEKAAKRMGGALAGLFALDKMRQFLVGVAEEADIMRGLSVTLRNAGNDADRVMPRLQQYFTDLQKATTHSDDEIALAFDAMVQGSGDAAKSLEYLTLVIDVAASKKGMKLVEAGDMIAQMMQGITRSAGAAFPQLRAYMESIEKIADPAERARLGLQKLLEVVQGREASNMQGLTAQWVNLTKQVGAFFELVEGKLHIVERLAQLVGTMRVMMETGLSFTPEQWAANWQKVMSKGIPGAPTIPGLGGGNPQGTYDNPFMMPEVKARVLPGRVGFEDQAFSPFSFRQLGGMREGPKDLKLGGFSDAWRDAAKDYEKGMKDADERIAQEFVRVQTEKAAALKGVFSQVWTDFLDDGKIAVDKLAMYIIKELGEGALAGLANKIFPGAGLSTGLFGMIFGGGGGGTAKGSAASSAVARNLQMRAVRLA